MIDITKYPTLAFIETPNDLRLLSKENLPKLCDELRLFLLNSVSQSGGHFASGLGVIEITVALHYIYKTPFDNLIWDVGHQAYPHKILTGRRDNIETIRKKNGLHSFPWRDESEYDILSVGHSSTSISVSLGMAVAAQRENINRKTVCVIGDGAITAGIAFEAMNHTGAIAPKNMLVILNDNDMSISKNIGALNKNLNNLSSKYKHGIFFKNKKKMFYNISSIKKIQKKTEHEIIRVIPPGIFFKELGFNYIGPINGHDVIKLTQELKNIRNLNGPQFLHILTKKGCGYKPAEKDPITWHFVPTFNPNEYSLPKAKKTIPTFSKIFGDWLCEEAKNDNKLIAITPAMCEGSGMTFFSKKYPKQYFDVAIAEQHAVTFAAGLAIKGYNPIAAIYSTFLQRSYDQIIHDIAIQKLPVMFAIDRAGIVGADGQTHQGSFDISFLRCIPTMIIMTPSDENECRLMLHTAYHYKDGPTAVRYPRGPGIGVKLQPLKQLPIGKGITRRYGKKIAILCFGTLLNNALEAATKINATVVDMRFAKPLDTLLILEIANTHELLVTLEENSIIGGAGSGVNEFLLQEKKILPILNLGLPDFFISQGTQKELITELGLDFNGIINSINKYIEK
ncbi:1-deoxy-D-xylulose-5-phosphate synthase [Candidatus Providencia siddallii]|uniref:1-deoxy-D-xylulose-5-phosphate synthase n=1 Tax=Candidatus Providencia siddallii TaxID=1715285 RepID=A0A0M6W9G1_9GAMM|nr:1-deoxy-D-xylulose-5-phosphate synthase [Candidatus Providencia siddallii]